jgi:sugar phosphate isomerase/epimerase
MSDSRLISLAAGALQEFPPEDVVHAAAQAGFNATGIWCDLDSWNSQCTRKIADALAETGLCPMDLEVVWLHPGESIDSHDAMIDIALELGVRNILCVSSEPDITRTKTRFEHLCKRAESGTMRVVLEFLAITEINTLQRALEVVQDVAHPTGGILVDTLHLHRTGACAQDLAGIDPTLMPYIQLCDATASLADSSPEGLLEDALYLRQLPGAGGLPLADMLAQLDPKIPLSLEVRSRDLIHRYPDDPQRRATCIFEATRKFLGSGS